MPQHLGTGRIVLRDLAPMIPDRGAAKAILGSPVDVGVTAFRDGHGELAVRARRRRIGGVWIHSPLTAALDDRFVGAVTFDELGVHELVFDGWTDRFSTWRRDMVLWLDAGEDVDSELLVGAGIIDELLPRASVEHRDRLSDAAKTMRSETCALRVRLDAGLDDAVAQALAGVADPFDLTSSASVAIRVERERAAIGAWYEFFPRSEGGFAPADDHPAGAIARLDAIADMGFDVVYLPPVHPIGATKRKGRNNSLTAGPQDPGSPWAIGSADGGHTAVDPSLGSLADFDRFMGRAAELGLEVALDYALQCSPDHPWLTEHPEWFAHRPDGTIRYAENPPKKYQDIHPLDFWPLADARAELWDECLRVLRFWMDHGVRVFRVDNPHTKPVAFWEWLLAQVAKTDPDVVFLSEAFTHPAMMGELAEVGFSQSYTYFTWRTTAGELREYIGQLAHGAGRDWFRPNFWPTTPDILAGPLRHGSRAVFVQRAVVAALASPSWGIYSGYELCENTPQSDTNEEFADSEKYRLVPRDWSDPSSLAPVITTLNRIRRDHPSVLGLTSTRFVETSDHRLLAWTRTLADGSDPVLVIVNCEPDVDIESSVALDAHSLGLGDTVVARDELTGETWEWRHGDNYVRLDSERVAHVMALSNPT